MPTRHPHTDAPACPGRIATLVGRCARGDEAALGQLFDVVVDLVRAELRRDVDLPDVDALVVSTFRRMWLQSRRYDPTSQDVVDWVLEQARVVSGRPTPTLVDLVA